MDEKIEAIYHARVNARRSIHIYEEIVKSIQIASKSSELPLREDAIYFLANNVADMVVGPMSDAGSQKIKSQSAQIVSEAELFSYIRADLSIIITVANSAALERKRKEISATSIVIGLAKVIDKLKINSTKLWD
jgi:hypothetical protein